METDGAERPSLRMENGREIDLRSGYCDVQFPHHGASRLYTMLGKELLLKGSIGAKAPSVSVDNFSSLGRGVRGSGRPVLAFELPSGFCGTGGLWCGPENYVLVYACE